MIEETEAIVLHAMKYGDTSKIVTLYTKKFGKIKVIAKGSRKANAKFGSSLEPMSHTSIVLYKKKTRDLHLLSKSEIVTPFKKLNSEPEKIFVGLAAVELVNTVMHDEEQNEKIFLLFVETLKAINAAAKNEINYFIHFLLNIVTLFGFRMAIDECSICKKQSQSEDIGAALFQLSGGKIVCLECSESHNSSGMKISAGALKSLNKINISQLADSTTLTLSNSIKNEILNVLQMYLRYHFENSRTLNSLSLLYK